MSNQRYIVVGAGHAGGRAVEAMRMAGFEGEIVLVGAEPHLPYERPPSLQGSVAGAARLHVSVHPATRILRKAKHRITPRRRRRQHRRRG